MISLLSIDSSTEALALALSAPAGRFFFEGEGGAKASAELLPQVRRLLRDAGLRGEQLDAIAFGRGPGAFTGLRTACAVAQGLAFGWNKPVLALDSLMLVAQDARTQGAPEGLPLWVLMDARMGEIYAGCYRRAGAAWQVVEAPALYSPEALRAHWSSQPLAVCGSALQPFAAQLSLEGVPAWPECKSRAAALAVLAEQAWAGGEHLDAAEAMPLYVRDKVAQTTAERAAAGGKA
ncbi:tRNA (adenosine(37)-N6)-threonylcarbamoyltransferase complex dimerization subunit type 1 TsaB [Pelomonas sp. SE-A7]|uniref:tRNA (adenosine(37)-N6)-threonylcarbamoyltransferase complex dimerization subunit type 1 TsaB n=1 Tax=Pelomonas sp. SE-A7 TaxID=3054953 RepID=UPI00259C9759|nr:tRNA (adenosine(37)-N6)-threonylcarbamoyltransferase complex dimerization subunit type 1 TsaB [Pelomonas sp. SE-A7]MDM4766719.1 tRNA (adenosine(37)-N6)-threonylcarbamoyltransferase complex dimerization subunit type 1 TsaB [Pelomonas sp. SE-A7]